MTSLLTEPKPSNGRIPNVYVWFSCRRDFRLLLMSVASVLEVVSRDTPLFIAQDASDPLSSRQVCWLESLSSRVCVLKDHELFHLGMSGLEQSHRLCQIHQRVASLSGSMYTTKIDSDCLMFADTLTPLLATNRFVLVGSWAEWGSWGAYCSYSHRVWERLSGMSLQYYQMLLESSSERPGNYDEDHIHPRLVSSLWPADSILLRKPDWKAGWFDAYQFGQQASRSAVNAASPAVVCSSRSRPPMNRRTRRRESATA